MKTEYLNYSFKREPIDYGILRLLKTKELEIVARCSLIHFKTKDELK